jgi:hypothetical protein
MIEAQISVVLIILWVGLKWIEVNVRCGNVFNNRSIR